MNYTTAPLPFLGQKKDFAGRFADASSCFTGITTVVDLFGGSGLLAHTAKQARPDLRVIWNDHDDFTTRLRGIQDTNVLLGKIRALLKDAPKGKRVADGLRTEVLATIKNWGGYLDPITVSSELFFAMNYASGIEDFENKTYYNNTKEKVYTAEGYLEGVETTRMDFRKLAARFQADPHVCFVMDPPYLSTESGHYKHFWRMADSLDTLPILEGHPFFYFSSDKSRIIELCDWMERQHGIPSPFRNAIRMSRSGGIRDIRITDLMLFRN